jgi:hypothetical protein
MDRASLATFLATASMATSMLFHTRSQAAEKPARIEAKEFVLVDETGSPRAVLGARDGRIGLSVLSSQGQTLSWIGCFAGVDEGWMQVRDPISGEQVAIGMLGNAYMPGIAVYDSERKRAFLGMDDTGSDAPWLRLYGKEGEDRIQTGIEGDGDSVLSMHDDRGSYAIMLNADVEDRANAISVYGGASEHRDLIHLGSTKRGEPFLIMTSPGGKMLHQAP